jgi:hypothetical protein
MADCEVIFKLFDDAVFTVYHQKRNRDHYSGECVRSWKNLTLSEGITPHDSFGQSVKHYKKFPVCYCDD